MTIWDKIYKNYQDWGEARATLKWWLISQFIEFIKKTEFKKKNVLDIGCGNGKYLVYLKSLWFNITGTDSSETAVEMTKKILGNEGNIFCANMYNLDIEPNKFWLIISIQTIHHGGKEEVQKLIDKIYEVLVDEGKIFLTLPDYQSSTYRNTFKDKEEIAPWTYSPLSWPEKWLPHSFFTQAEVQELFKKFKNIVIELDGRGKWIITWTKEDQQKK